MHSEALMTGKKACGKIEKVLQGHKSLSHRYRWIFISSSLNR